MKKITSLYLLNLLIATHLSCTPDKDKEGDLPSIVSNFTFSMEGSCESTSLEVIFENKSENATSFIWDFGDGTTSTLENPSKIYAKAGNYDVKLSAIAHEKSSIHHAQIDIRRNSDGKGPSADFDFTKKPGTLTFTFTNKSSEASDYFWDFGDGTTSTSRDAVHTYGAYGNYRITLYAGNSDGKNCMSKTILLDPFL